MVAFCWDGHCSLHSGPIKTSLFSPSPTHLSAIITSFTLVQGNLRSPGGNRKFCSQSCFPQTFSLCGSLLYFPERQGFWKLIPGKHLFSAVALSLLSLEAMNREPELKLFEEKTNNTLLNISQLFHTATDFWNFLFGITPIAHYLKWHSSLTLILLITKKIDPKWDVIFPECLINSFWWQFHFKKLR